MIGKAFVKLSNGQEHHLIVDEITVTASVDEATEATLRGKFDTSPVPVPLNLLSGDTVRLHADDPSTLRRNEVKNPDGTETWIEVCNPGPQESIRTVFASEWSNVRTVVQVTDKDSDCFCCTCSSLRPDPHCRDHGWEGMRGCTEHKRPPVEYAVEVVHPDGSISYENVTPVTVQEYRGE